ncbi:hypothetical protein BT96DRAFT_77716 [Gymnopus androsaceus JB14]|uniref:Uncharacterized protein n=1 Tax=Gymnopus androsaceus JB14 TaxID=1447944 RepID=A0A6A4HJD4_9AGAR|nr:hypothetical protein BT96DRAFT_77716 [Gymnopus androsaceus JB14]
MAHTIITSPTRKAINIVVNFLARPSASTSTMALNPFLSTTTRTSSFVLAVHRIQTSVHLPSSPPPSPRGASKTDPCSLDFGFPGIGFSHQMVLIAEMALDLTSNRCSLLA